MIIYLYLQNLFQAVFLVEVTLVYFWSHGYDVIFYYEYHFNPNYHSNGDIIRIMNIDYATNVSKLMLDTLAELAEVHLIHFHL